MANNKNFIAKNGVSTGDGYAMPDVRPSLLLDFANSKTLDPRITFTRGSTATYWDGKTTTKAEENLVPSQGFSSAWSQSSVTTSAITSPTAPDGTTTAFRLQSTGGANTGIYVPASTVGNPPAGSTISLYAQAGSGGGNRLGLSASSGGLTNAAVFNLSTGAVDNSSGCTATMTAVGNGWYRCVVSNIATALTYFLFTVKDANSAIWGVGSDTTSGANIYIWGAQAETRTSATAYTPTSGTPIVKYQPTLQTAASGEARFDHDPVTGESKGLLIEEARTNSLTYSEAFDDASFTKQAVTVEANQAVAPDGTLTADKLVIDSGANTHQIVKLGVISSQTCSVSIFAKAAGVNTFTLLDGAVATNGASFNLSTGVATDVNSGTGTIENVGNGWYRCTAVMTTTGFRLYCPNATGTAVGDDFNGILIWGAQLEAGAFPTSYIPTSGSTVTRSGDRASMSLSGVYSSGPVSMYVEAAEAGDVDYARLVMLSDGTNDNRMQITISESSGYIQSFVETSNLAVAQINVNFDPDYKTFFKAAAAYDRNDFAVTAGGLTVGTDTSGNTPEVTHMYLGSLNDADADSGATFKKVALYPTRLSNATLQQMTEE